MTSRSGLRKKTGDREEAMRGVGCRFYYCRYSSVVECFWVHRRMRKGKGNDEQHLKLLESKEASDFLYMGNLALKDHIMAEYVLH